MTTSGVMPSDLTNALRAGIEAARSASAAAAQVAASALVRAGGSGSVHHAWRGEGPDAWCKVTGVGFTAHLLKHSYSGSHGDRAQIEFTGLSAEAYERMRDRVLRDEQCPHDLACECVTEPWPSLGTLRSEREKEISTREDEVRGFAEMTSSRVNVTLWDESVWLLYELVEISRSGTQS